MQSDSQDHDWQRLCEFIALWIGLDFPRERWTDLQRGFKAAAREFGFDDLSDCITWLLAKAPDQRQLEVLASHLTIGETYLFRESGTMCALAEKILPDLIRARRQGMQGIRIWSAGCCTGEEAYTLAIMLHRLLPDLADWRIMILGTDLNPQFLKRAAEGVYSEWSFRSAPAWLKKSYFNARPDGRYSVAPAIRKMVRFAPLNLAGNGFPSAASHTEAMDLILCRNVLMYFAPALIPAVIARLHQALTPGGWLALSPSEASTALLADFEPVEFAAGTLFQKRGVGLGKIAGAPAAMPIYAPPPAAAPVCIPTAPSPSGAREPAAEVMTLALRARELADSGKLVEALSVCDDWLALDKLSAAGFYLRSIILQEQGLPDEARSALQTAVYLDQEFVLAHFSLGYQARMRGMAIEAARHFANVQQLLNRCMPEQPLPESDGLTAGHLREIIAALNGAGNPS